MTNDLPLITCSFPDEKALLRAYMPFVKGGAIFIRTTEVFQLESQVKLSVALLDEADHYLVEGKVVWVTPKGAVGNKPSGIGVQFTEENGRRLRNKIETYLAGMLTSTHMTDTL